MRFATDHDLFENPALKCATSRFCACQAPPNKQGRALRHCPAHEDARPSLSIAVGGDGKLLWKCHAGCTQERVLAALRRAGVLPDPRGHVSAPGARITDYPVRDPEGNIVAVHRRIETDTDKRFVWLQPDGTPGLGGKRVSDLPLYGLPALGDQPEEPVVLVEGEKACDALLGARVLAAGTVTGAQTIPSDEALRPLVGRDVICWADNDEPGRAHMRRIAERLLVLGARSVRLACWHEGAEGADAHDAIALMGPAWVREFLNQAPQYVPPVGAPSFGVVMRRMEDVRAEETTWAWRGWIPRGALTLVAGEPGVGKTLLAMHLAARWTKGDVEGDLHGKPVRVGFSSGEDSPSATLKPRFLAAGGDARLAFFIEFREQDGTARNISLPGDIAALADLVKREGIEILVIDPIAAHLAETVNSWREGDVRRVLAPLARLAYERGCSVVAIHHLNKARGGDALARVGGSVGFPAAARSVLLVGRDPFAGSGVVAHLKSNMGTLMAPLGFGVEETTASEDGPAGRKLVRTARLVWMEGVPSVSVEDILRPWSVEERASIEGAIEWLRDALSNGPRSSEELRKEAERAHISLATLKRAKERLGVRHERRGLFGRSVWVLPEGPGGDGDGEVIVSAISQAPPRVM